MLKRGLSILAIVLAGGCTQQPSSSPPATSPPPAVKPAGAAADAPKESTVQITFDGGYAFVHHTASRQLTVASINDNVGHDAEKMHLRADVGTYRELSNAFPPSKPAEQIWEIGKDKDGFDIDVLGVAPGITLPKSDPTMVCNPVPEHQADNLYLIPNITELARAATNGTNRGEITKDRRRFLNRVHLEGGDVVFRRASSCFEYDLNNTKTQKRFIGGRETVSVVFKIAGPLLTLQFTSVKDPSKKTNVGIEADRAGLIRLTFGRLHTPCVGNDCPTLPVGGELQDFARFFKILVTPVGMPPKPIKKAERMGDPIRTPGDECPPGWYEDPPPPAPAARNEDRTISQTVATVARADLRHR